MNSRISRLLHSSPETWYRYPINVLGKTVYKFKSQLGLTSAFERRQEMVGPTHLWRMKRDFQIGFLKKVGLKPQHYVLDLGCGVLRGGLPIIEYLEPGHYYGIESRRSVLDEGIKALHEAGLQSKAPTLLALEDLAHAKLDRHFDVIWAFSVLIHMEDRILDDCLTLVSGRLERNGRLYANVSIGNEKDGNWQGFPVVNRSREFYKDAAQRHGLTVIEVGTLQSIGHRSGAPSQDLQVMLEFVPAA